MGVLVEKLKLLKNEIQMRKLLVKGSKIWQNQVL